MADGKLDPHTGRMTTGHEWNGITELNTPVPKAVWVFLVSAVLCAVIMWILLPTWPTIESYTKGVLGEDQREIVEDSLKKSALNRAPWETKIESISFSEIENDNNLMAIVSRNGQRLFEDNCAMCHGMNGQGGHGYPSLTDDQWLWGGDAETIMETIRVGINTTHEDTRYSQMLPFGQDGLLSVSERRNVIHYVQSLSKLTNDFEPEVLSQGKTIFMENCAACHGESATGMKEVGAPNLTDNFWLYGNDYETLSNVVRNGLQGVMPYWEGRLSHTDRKILTLYIRDLGKENND